MLELLRGFADLEHGIGMGMLEDELAYYREVGKTYQGAPYGAGTHVLGFGIPSINSFIGDPDQTVEESDWHGEVEGCPLRMALILWAQRSEGVMTTASREWNAVTNWREYFLRKRLFEVMSGTCAVSVDVTGYARLTFSQTAPIRANQTVGEWTIIAASGTPIIITLSAGHGMDQGQRGTFVIRGAVGNAAVNGLFIETGRAVTLGGNTIELEGTTSVGTWTSGGKVFKLNAWFSPDQVHTATQNFRVLSGSGTSWLAMPDSVSTFLPEGPTAWRRTFPHGYYRDSYTYGQDGSFGYGSRPGNPTIPGDHWSGHGLISLFHLTGDIEARTEVRILGDVLHNYYIAPGADSNWNNRNVSRGLARHAQMACRLYMMDRADPSAVVQAEKWRVLMENLCADLILNSNSWYELFGVYINANTDTSAYPGSGGYVSSVHADEIAEALSIYIRLTTNVVKREEARRRITRMGDFAKAYGLRPGVGANVGDYATATYQYYLDYAYQPTATPPVAVPGSVMYHPIDRGLTGAMGNVEANASNQVYGPYWLGILGMAYLHTGDHTYLAFAEKILDSLRYEFLQDLRDAKVIPATQVGHFLDHKMTTSGSKYTDQETRGSWRIFSLLAKVRRTQDASHTTFYSPGTLPNRSWLQPLPTRTAQPGIGLSLDNTMWNTPDLGNPPVVLARRESIGGSYGGMVYGDGIMENGPNGGHDSVEGTRIDLYRFNRNTWEDQWRPEMPPDGPAVSVSIIASAGQTDFTLPWSSTSAGAPQQSSITYVSKDGVLLQLNVSFTIIQQSPETIIRLVTPALVNQVIAILIADFSWGFVATAGQTVFTPTGSDGYVSGGWAVWDPSYWAAQKNGIPLVQGPNAGSGDYHVTGGRTAANAIVLHVAAVGTDRIRIWYGMQNFGNFNGNSWKAPSGKWFSGHTYDLGKYDPLRRKFLWLRSGYENTYFKHRTRELEYLVGAAPRPSQDVSHAVTFNHDFGTGVIHYMITQGSATKGTYYFDRSTGGLVQVNLGASIPASFTAQLWTVYAADANGITPIGRAHAGKHFVYIEGDPFLAGGQYYWVTFDPATKQDYWVQITSLAATPGFTRPDHMCYDGINRRVLIFQHYLGNKVWALDPFTDAVTDVTPVAGGLNASVIGIDFSGNNAGFDIPNNAAMVVASSPGGSQEGGFDGITTLFRMAGSVSGAIAVLFITPSSAVRGTSFGVTISGFGFVGGTGGSISVSGAGVTVTNRVFVNENTLTCTFTIAVDALANARDVTVMNPDLTTATLPGGFSVNGPPVNVTLHDLGFLRDRVGQGNLTGPDTVLDRCFRLDFASSDACVVTSADMVGSLSGRWDTNGGTGFWRIGVAATLDSALLNSAVDDGINTVVGVSGSLRFFAADLVIAEFPNGLFAIGTVITLTVIVDGQSKIAQVTITGPGEGEGEFVDRMVVVGGSYTLV